MKNRERFSGKVGFVLACVGSAVGMGNIWLFPYRTGQYGGAAFLIPLGALLAAVMFFWVCGKDFARQQVQMGHKKPIGRWFEPLTRYGFVGLTVTVYLLGIFYGGIG